MAEHIKIDKAKIKAVGQTITHKGEVILVTRPGSDMPTDCIVLFVDKVHWDEIKGRLYA